MLLCGNRFSKWMWEKNLKFNFCIIKLTIQKMLNPSVDRNGRGGGEALRDEVGLPQLKKKIIKKPILYLISVGRLLMGTAWKAIEIFVKTQK